MQSDHKLPEVAGSYRHNANLAPYCWLKVGGCAQLLFKPFDSKDLQLFLRAYQGAVLPLGAGSNLLIREQGFAGCVIKLGRSFNTIEMLDDTHLLCGAAALDTSVADFALQRSLTGLEFLSGIPGSIGGALAMNAGAYGTEISDVLLQATAINLAGEERVFSCHEIGYHYRGKTLGEEWIFTHAILRSQKAQQGAIAAKMQEIAQQRQKTQPIRTRTGGSTFRNPPACKAWQLIEAASCRGLTIGGAQVSHLHCNFFINTGQASAQDFIDLIELVKRKVYDHCGIMLQEEIKII